MSTGSKQRIGRAQVPLTSLVQLALELPSCGILYVLSTLSLGPSTHALLKDTGPRSDEGEDLCSLDSCRPSSLAMAQKPIVDREMSGIILSQLSGAIMATGHMLS